MPRLSIALLAGVATLGVLLSACSEKFPSTSTLTPQPSPQTGGAAAPAGPKSTSPATALAAGGPTFDAKNAIAHINALATKIGTRVAGSPGERSAVEYISGQFKASGYSVEVKEFDFPGDPFRPATLMVAGQKVEVLALSGSAGATVTGNAVFVGLADDAGIAGRDLTGKVAVADRGTLRYSDKMDNVKKAGAVALVIINSADEELLGNLTKTATIPVAGVSQKAGAAVRDAATKGTPITVETPPVGNTHSQNVVAKAAPGACLVLVGGHHDTVPGAPGAHDNASGAAETIELARAFGADGLDKGLCFATFGAEESGLNGSKALVADLQQAGALPKFFVNLDTTGVGTRIDLIGSPELQRQAAALAQSLGINAAPTELGANFGSDHQSFSSAGVPVLFFATNDIGRLHTPGDVADQIQPAIYQQGGDLAYAFIAQLLKQVAGG